MSTIGIETSKTDYAGGETVEGAVILELDDPIPVRGVRVRFVGGEEAKWSTVPGRNLSHHRDTHTLFDTERTLLGKPSLPLAAVVKDALLGVFTKEHYEVIEPGKHELPFTFELPESLPGDYESPRGSAIRYEIQATVDVPLRIDLEATKRLTVYEKAERAELAPAAAKQRRTFTFDKSAAVEIALAVDHTHFVPGDRTRCTVTICNRASKTIAGVRVLIRQREDLMVLGVPQDNRFETILAERPAGDLPNGEPVEIELDIELPSDLYATITTGRLVKVCYQLVAELDMPWARDLEVSVPIVLHEVAGMPSGPVADASSP